MFPVTACSASWLRRGLLTPIPTATQPARSAPRGVQEMHPFPAQDVYGSREGRGGRRDEDRVAPIFEFFDDERRHESILDLGQRRLPHVLLALSCQLSGQTSQQYVARDFHEQGIFDSLPKQSAAHSAHGDTDEEADEQTGSGERARSQRETNVGASVRSAAQDALASPSPSAAAERRGRAGRRGAGR